MKLWTLADPEISKRRPGWLRALLLRIRDALDLWLEGEPEVEPVTELRGAEDAPTAELPSAAAVSRETSEEIPAWQALQNAGPPEEWLELVRKGAPELLQQMPVRMFESERQQENLSAPAAHDPNSQARDSHVRIPQSVELKAREEKRAAKVPSRIARGNREPLHIREVPYHPTLAPDSAMSRARNDEPSRTVLPRRPASVDESSAPSTAADEGVKARSSVSLDLKKPMMRATSPRVHEFNAAHEGTPHPLAASAERQPASFVGRSDPARPIAFEKSDDVGQAKSRIRAVHRVSFSDRPVRVNPPGFADSIERPVDVAQNAETGDSAIRQSQSEKRAAPVPDYGSVLAASGRWPELPEQILRNGEAWAGELRERDYLQALDREQRGQV